MEVVEYLRGAGRRKWILIGLPLLFLALVVPWALSRPQEYRTTSTVSVQPSTGFQGPSAVRSFVDSFVQVAKASAVLERASQESGVPVTDFRGSLSVTPVGASPLVEIGVTTTDRQEGEKVTTGLIRAALAIPLDALIEQTQVEMQAVEKDARAAADQVRALEQTAGGLTPAEAYRVAVAEVARIKSALALESDTVSTADLETALADLRSARRDYKKYQELSVLAAQKQNQVSVVEARLRQYEERREQIDGAVFTSTTKPISTRPLLIQSVVAAVIVGLLVAGGILVVGEWWRRRRDRGRDREERGMGVDRGQ